MKKEKIQLNHRRRRCVSLYWSSVQWHENSPLQMMEVFLKADVVSVYCQQLIVRGKWFVYRYPCIILLKLYLFGKPIYAL